MRKNLFLASPAKIACDKVHRFWKNHVKRISSLHHHDSRILSERPRERSIACVNRIDATCPCMEKGIDKAPDMTSKIGTYPSPGGDPEMGERPCELLTPSPYIRHNFAFLLTSKNTLAMVPLHLSLRILKSLSRESQGDSQERRVKNAHGKGDLCRRIPRKRNARQESKRYAKSCVCAGLKRQLSGRDCGPIKPIPIAGPRLCAPDEAKRLFFSLPSSCAPRKVFPLGPVDPADTSLHVYPPRREQGLFLRSERGSRSKFFDRLSTVGAPNSLDGIQSGKDWGATEGTARGVGDCPTGPDRIEKKRSAEEQ